MNLIDLVHVVASTITAFMIGMFILSLLIKRNDIADSAWGIGFVIIALTCLQVTSNINLKAIIVYSAVVIWGLRLSAHIFLRNISKPEDFRYHKWRLEWGRWFYLRSFIQVYLLQGVFMLVISMPILFVSLQNDPNNFGLLNWIGLAVLGIGYFFEIVADWQLRQFKRNPKNKGKLLRSGLWAYSRHPNYFGESCVWWGIWFLSVSSIDDIVSLISPITITYLLLFVSGIPMLEEKMNKHPDFQGYSQKTNKFFPWFTKKIQRN